MFERIEKGLYWDRLLRLIDGCTPCSPGCRCWVAREAKVRTYGAKDLLGSDGMWNGQIRLRHDNLDLPIRTKKPQAWLILNDLFHEDVPEEFIAATYGVASVCPDHTFLILTKRADRMVRWYQKHTNYSNWCINEACLALPDIRTFGIRLKQDRTWPLPNVWLGCTVVNQQEADEKISLLLQIQAAVRWVSLEPLLDPIDLSKWFWDFNEDYQPPRFLDEGETYRVKPNIPSHKISWVVAGGETGPGARPMNPEWAVSVKDQCVSAGTPFFFKGYGKYRGEYPGYYVSSGRLLDGREYSEIPEVKK